MDKYVLEMKYHPAKKEVKFRRFQNDKEVEIPSDSCLMKYEQQEKGGFVLQNYGNDFFNDIAKTFDGIKDIYIDVITTKLDYDDFEKMVEFYNNDNENDIKIHTKLKSELPNMLEIYQKVRTFGEEGIKILKSSYYDISEIPHCNSNLEKSTNHFKNKLTEEINNIEASIQNLNENKVNLCFAGVYSSGKSALINALLGYKILPESIKSKTSKMCVISSPESEDLVSIKFSIDNNDTELIWDTSINNFKFTRESYENDIRTEIQKILDKIKCEEKKQFEQIYSLLEYLNDTDKIADKIEINFPIPIDNENVKFKIYDTPGTDSNNSIHDDVLESALDSQIQSILIFVGTPDRLEGNGNEVLFKYLKNAQEKKTHIDNERSLFVINKADSVKKNVRKELQTGEIKYESDSDINIKLSNKKLFFTSATYAYASCAVKNNFESDDEKEDFENGTNLILNNEKQLYKENLIAKSEIETKNMINNSDIALKNALERNDKCDALYIASGLYALENEIINYAEKYAPSVKTHAIINSIDDTLKELKKESGILKEKGEEELYKLQNKIKNLKDTIESNIYEIYQDIIIKDNDLIPDDIVKKLCIDSHNLNFYSSSIKTFADKILGGWLLGKGDVPFKDSDKDKINSELEKSINKFRTSFLDNRYEQIKYSQKKFIDNVKTYILQNDDFSESEKEYFIDIPEPKIPEPKISDFVQKIYDENKKSWKLLWLKFDNLDKEKFMEDLGRELLKIFSKFADDFKKDYTSALKIICDDIEYKFKQNLENYSLTLKAMIENKDEMNKLKETIEHAQSTLQEKIYALDNIIWNLEEKNNE